MVGLGKVNSKALHELGALACVYDINSERARLPSKKYVVLWYSSDAFQGVLNEVVIAAPVSTHVNYDRQGPQSDLHVPVKAVNAQL